MHSALLLSQQGIFREKAAGVSLVLLHVPHGGGVAFFILLQLLESPCRNWASEGLSHSDCRSEWEASAESLVRRIGKDPCHLETD